MNLRTPKNMIITSAFLFVAGFFGTLAFWTTHHPKPSPTAQQAGNLTYWGDASGHIRSATNGRMVSLITNVAERYVVDFMRMGEPAGFLTVPIMEWTNQYPVTGVTWQASDGSMWIPKWEKVTARKPQESNGTNVLVPNWYQGDEPFRAGMKMAFEIGASAAACMMRTNPSSLSWTSWQEFQSQVWNSYTNYNPRGVLVP